jgi:methionyl-tRNA synthetase
MSPATASSSVSIWLAWPAASNGAAMLLSAGVEPPRDWHVHGWLLVGGEKMSKTALNQIAPAAKRKRTEFIRQAVKEAIRRQEYARMREAYLKRPDSAADSDDWSNCEKFEA